MSSLTLGKRLGSIEAIDAHIKAKIKSANEKNKTDPKIYPETWLKGIIQSWENVRPQLIEQLEAK